MLFSKSIVEIIKERTSWRTYLNKPLEKEARSQINEILKLEGIESPFKDQSNRSRFHLISVPEFDPNENLKIGTYGMIKGAQEFITGATEKSEYDLEDYGYLFEAIILAATDINLKTCWLGGTFNRSQISKIIHLKDNEIIPAITPIGYPATRRLKERFIRSLAKAKVRKPWEQVFYVGDFNTPINHKSIGEYKTILEMVRIGPSAGNNQPWRILKDNNRDVFHFFVKYSDSKRGSIYSKFVRLDIGIAVCHFDLTANELGLKGKWEFLNPDISSSKGLKYTITWNGA
ncbi:MAG: nitroreductase family protein [Candidatus Odinarchaeota archaeon]